MKLTWVDVLNAQTRWFQRSQLIDWFRDLVGRQVTLLDGTIEGFEEALGFMRRQVANAHFGEPIDLLWLDTQLKTVTLGLLHHQGAQEGDTSKLPLFRARVKGLHDTDLLRALKDTLLVQFAEYIGEVVDGEANGADHVWRCDGLHKRSAATEVAHNAQFSDEVEQRWRSEVTALVPSEDLDQVERCPNLFVSAGGGNGRGARYCSDACRFSTQQVTQQAQEPEILVEKQRRFRRRNKA